MQGWPRALFSHHKWTCQVILESYMGQHEGFELEGLLLHICGELQS